MKCGPVVGLDLTIMKGVYNATVNQTIGSMGSSINYLAYAYPWRGEAPGIFPTYDDFVSGAILGTTAYEYSPSYANGTFMHVISGNNSLACQIRKTRYSAQFTFSGNTEVAPDYTDFEVLESADPGDEVAMALAQALLDILGGVIYVTTSAPAAHSDECGGSFLQTFNTRIMETALIGVVDTQNTVLNGMPYCQTSLPPISAADQALARNMSIGPLIEELSRNQTWSLFSSSRLW